VSGEKGAALTLANDDRFSKFFTDRLISKFLENQTHRYTTLWNICAQKS